MVGLMQVCEGCSAPASLLSQRRQLLTAGQFLLRPSQPCAALGTAGRRGCPWLGSGSPRLPSYASDQTHIEPHVQSANHLVTPKM